MKKKVATIATAAILSSAFASTAFADTYTVKSGDTLSHIARNHSITVSKLKSLNGLSSDLIFPNQKLTVSKTTEVQPSTPAPSAPSTTTNTGTSTYTIKSGDTLSAIASKHKVTVAKLKSWNKLTSDLIFPGQKLSVSDPAKGTTTAPAPSAPQAPSTGSTAPAPSNETATTVYYKIKAGDTLGKIAQQHKMTVTQLKALNNLSSDLIYAGKTLKVSGQVTISEPEKEVAASNSADQLIKDAKALLGTPYVWGGSSTKGFDCSGFINYVYNKSGKGLVRTSADGYFNRSYYVDKPQPGDLVFFANTYKKGISHVGIYLGNNEFIHAGNDKVEISSLTNTYYKKHFESFKRFY
ncbi:LysM peptidoglycan-binding domain-containing protein [Mesobacillus maritimus]|uniref:C40 family peptidase n=1 Tax=Mesobacillus maritimus TaxID=1643336 RepID=UPI00384FB6F1